MAELIVVGFDGMHRATEVLDQLQVLDSISAVELDDAVAVYRASDGQLRIDKSVYPAVKEKAAWGAVLGAAAGGLLLSPLTAAISVPAQLIAMELYGAAFGAAGGAKAGHDLARARERYGISEDFVKQVGGMVQPGQSALFAIVQADNPEAIAAQFRGAGGRILRTTLKDTESAQLQQTLSG